MSNTITLVLNLVCIAFIAFGILWGLIRGLKKTVSRGLFLLIISIVTLFITIPITNLILNIPITINTVIDGTTYADKYTLVEFLTLVMENMIGENFVTNNPDFASSLVSIPLLLINAIVYGVVFWILKILLLPLNALFNKLIFKDRKPKENLAFCAMNNPDYPNSDPSIKPLTDIYVKSQTESENNSSKAGMFIKKEDEILKNSPSATAPQNANIIANTPAEDKKAKKQIKKQKHIDSVSKKPKKHRLLGGLVGAVVGVIVMFNTMVPIYGIISIVKDTKNMEITNTSGEEISLNAITNGLSDDIIKGYELSALARVSKMIGIEQLGLLAFDKVTTTTINEEKIVLRDDVSALLSTVQEANSVLESYQTVSNNGLENITQEQLTELINGVDNVITKSEQVKLVDALGSYVIPITAEYIVHNEIKFTENETINMAITNVLIELAKDNQIAILNELKSVLDIAKYLSDQGILLKIVQNDYSDILTVIENLDEDFDEQLTTKLFNIKIIDNTLPKLLNLGLTVADEMLNFGYTDNGVSAEELKVIISDFMSNTIGVARSLSSDSPIYVTDDSLIAIGTLLNNFKNSKLFNDTTYNNLVDIAVEKIKQFTTQIIPDNFKNFFNNHLLRNVCDVTDWEQEMKVFADALKILRDKDTGIIGQIVDDKDYKVGYSVDIKLQEETFINIGKALDQLEKSVLLGSKSRLDIDSTTYENTTMISLFNSIFTELKSTFETGENSITKELGEIISLMSNNLVKSNHLYVENSSFWEDEMTSISPLLINIYDIAKSETLDITSDLGSALDKSTSSILLGNDTTLKLMNKLIKIVKDQVLGEDYTLQNDDSLNDNIYKLMTDIENNLLSPELYTTMQSDSSFWEKEISAIMSLKNIADKAGSISTLQDAQLLASDLDGVLSSRIIPQSAFNSTIACVLRQLKTTANTGVEGSINTLIESIATDITSNTFWDSLTDKSNFWTIEMSYITSLTDLQFTNTTDYNVVDNLGSIGATLDTITKGDGSTRGSYLLTELRIRELLSTAVSELKDTITGEFNSSLQSTIQSVLQDISNNIYNPALTSQIVISSFESELTHLQTLASLNISSTLFEYTTDTASLTQELQGLGAQLDSVAFNTISEENIIKFDESKNSKIITRSSISSIVISAFNMAKPAEDGVYSQLITNIQASINDIANADKVISWKRELSYVVTLIQLNSGESYTLDNAGDKLAKYLDLIGFNTLSGGDFADIKYNSENNIIGENTYSYPLDSTTKYYNSVIITRAILQSAVNSILTSFKVEETSNDNKITNELIDNLTVSINITTITSDKYNNYTEAFNDLKTVKDDMEAMASNVDGKEISEINGSDIDTMLDGFQDKPISGVITTRKIALLIIDKIKTKYASTPGFELTPVGQYLSSLETHYNDNISSTTKEEYVSTTSASEYANPFATLISKISA